MTNDFKKEKKEDYFVNLKAISTEVLQEKVQDNAWVIVDTRLNDAYNGWKLDGVKRGGHIKGAVDFSANWLSVYSDRKDEVLDALRANPNEQTAQELAEQLGVDRTNVSRYLNELTKDGKVKKLTVAQ